MFCTNCGSKIEDDAVFCPECGTNMQEAEEKDVTNYESESGVAGVYEQVSQSDFETNQAMFNSYANFCPMCGNSVSADAEWCPVCGNSIGRKSNTGMGKQRKGNIVLMAGGIISAAIVLVIVALFIGKGNNKVGPILYVKDDDLMANHYKEGKSEQVERNFTDEGSNCVMTKDKKFLYYVKDRTLYVKKVNKLEGDETRIARDVVRFSVLDNNEVVFLQDDGTLYISDRKNDERIARDVTSEYRINEGNNEVIWCDTDGNLYWQDLAMKKEQKKLAEDVEYLDKTLGDFSKIAYKKDDGFYILADLEDEECIAKKYKDLVTISTEKDIVAYYTTEEDSENGKSIYDYIIDDLAEQDSSIKEPVYEEYETEREFTDMWGNRRTEYSFDDSYYEDYETYEEKEKRDEDRETLKDELVSFSKCGLFYYSTKEGSQNLGEFNDVIIKTTYQSNSPVIVVKMKEGLASSAKKLSDLYSSGGDIYDFCDEVESIVKGGAKYRIYYGTESAELDVETEEEVNILGINENEKVLYLSSYQGDNSYYDLLQASYGSNLGETDEIEKDVDSGQVVEGELFYCIGDKLYHDGKRLDMDGEGGFLVYAIEDSEKKIILCYEDESEYDESTVYIWDGKKAKKVADDIWQYVALSEDNIALLQDYSTSSNEGDLIYYNGRKVTLLEDSISYLIAY